MNITDLKSSLPYLFQSNLTPFLWGHAGIGKTTVIKQFAIDKGYKFFPLYLGTQADLGDVLGLQDFVKNAEGRSVATEFAMPIWLREIIDYCEQNPDSGAVIFLDEFNRARKDILQGMFSLALDKTFHTIKLPVNCHLVAAGNPPTEEYMTTDVDDTALMARFVHVKLEPTFQEFVDYAEGRKFEPTLISFLKEQPQLLEDQRGAFNLPIKVDRRSYERASRLFKINTPGPLLTQLLHGIIGIERTVQYELHLKNLEKPLTGEQIVEGQGKDLLAAWSTPGNITASCITVTCDNLVSYFKANKDTTLTKDQSDNVLNLFVTIPKDITHRYLTEIFKLALPVCKTFFNTEPYQSELVKVIKVAKNMETTKAGNKPDDQSAA